MRLFIVLISSIFLLSACANNAQVSDATPKIPDKKPRIPQYELKASVLDHDYSKYDVEDMERLLKEIDKDLNRPNITEDDIRRGWYLGSYEDKKYGTPDSWIWEDGAEESRWVSPNSVEETDYFEEKELCISTAGRYLISCVDSESSDCEYIPETKCECIEGSSWIDDQGCIMLDEEGNFISIPTDELKRGWYQGLPNEKKLNTPSSWVWVEGGQDSRWQNPNN